MTSACFILASLYVGFTYNNFWQKKYTNVYVLHGTKTNGNLDCSYYETYTYKNFTGIFTCMQNGRVVHYFEYADLRFDGMEINLQKQKD